MIYSLEIEKHVLGGLIRNPEVFADIDTFTNEYDFFNNTHSSIYSVIKSIASSGEKIDKVLLAEKIRNLGISFKEDINIFDYIEAISFTQITPKATFEACQELVKIRIRREIFQTAQKIQTFVQSPGDKPINEILSLADAMYNEKVSAYDFNDGPIDLFEDMQFIVEKQGENPTNEIGLITPYSEYNRLFGGYRQGNIYCVVSRASQGKSTWLTDTLFNTSIINKIPILYLDTEMDPCDVRMRLLASLSGVPYWYIEHGQWRKNPEMIKKVRDTWPLIKNYHFHHYHVKNKPIDEVLSIIRRWKLSKVGRDEKSLLCYDYIKITGEKIGQGQMETQIIGEKIDKLKRIAEETKSPLITAVQANRSGVAKDNEVNDDSSIIALSDRLLWFASQVDIFRRKTIEELAEDNPRFGTHKFLNLKARFQGKDAAGHQDFIKIQDDHTGKARWVKNYINYNVENFKVEEVGSLRHVIEYKNQQFDIKDKQSKDSGELL